MIPLLQELVGEYIIEDRVSNENYNKWTNEVLTLLKNTLNINGSKFITFNDKEMLKNDILTRDKYIVAIITGSNNDIFGKNENKCFSIVVGPESKLISHNCDDFVRMLKIGNKFEVMY